MKTFHNILKIIFGVIIATAIFNTAVGQSIKTPMNQTVYTLYNWDTTPLIAEWEDEAASWIIEHESEAVKVGDATSNYNCHSWAWHVSDGGSASNSWINYIHNGGANLSKYWTNDAYSPGSPNIDDNCKLFYGTTADHSAVYTTTSGIVESKWAWWPRYLHLIADCPFQNNPTYTTYSSPISGDNDICTSKTYTATNISGATYTWSGNKLSTSGSAYSTTATKTSDGEGWIHAEIYSPYSGTTFGSAKKPIWLGVPSTTSVTMPSQTPPYEGCTYTSHTFRAQPANSVSTQSYYSWEIDPNDGYISTSGNGEYSYITFYNEYSVAGYDVKARGTNSCGAGPFGETNIWIYDCYYFAISPNPASDIVTITRVLASEDTNGKTIMTKSDDVNTTSDIQIIDYYGSSHLQTTKSGDSFTLPVSNLKDGTYFVKITNGNKTSSLKLVVKH